MCTLTKTPALFQNRLDAEARERSRTISALVAVKQWDRGVDSLEKKLVRFFDAQVVDAATRLARMPDTAGYDPAEYANAIFNPSAWDRRLMQTVVPDLAKMMASAGMAELVMLRQIPKASKAATTAEQWFTEHGIDVPENFATTMPSWMKREIVAQLKEAMQQPYWQKINKTTRNDIEAILKRGLKQGNSTQQMAKEIMRKRKNYSKARATAVARTEAGNALNAGRDLCYNRLKTELPEEAAKFIGKEWLSVLGNTTRATHADADGQYADEDGLFNLAGYKVPWPSHYSLPGHERINCQCTITTAFGVGAPQDQIDAILAEGAITPAPTEPEPITPEPPAPEPVPTPEPPKPAISWQQDMLGWLDNDPEINRIYDEFVAKTQDLSKQVAEAHAEATQLEKKVRTLHRKWLKNRGQGSAILQERAETISKMVDAVKRREDTIVRIREALYEPRGERMKMPLSIDSTIYMMEPVIVSSTYSAFDFVSSVMPRSMSVPQLSVHGNNTGRAGYKSNAMYLSAADRVATYVHEMGHHIEENAGGNKQLVKASDTFLTQRIIKAGTSDVKLAEKFPRKNFQSWEVGNKDSFDKVATGRTPSKEHNNAVAHYIGKRYYHGAPGEVTSTEVISTGLEILYEDPVRFAQTDPQYFKFILGVIKGKFI
jgi:hypothetical protein